MASAAWPLKSASGGDWVSPVHPEGVGDPGKAHVFELDDMSSRPKAATCRRTPNALGLKSAGGGGSVSRVGRTDRLMACHHSAACGR